MLDSDRGTSATRVLDSVATAGREVAAGAVQQLKNRRISTESLTFLFSISIGLISTLLDIDEPYKSICNVCFGGSCAFFAPIIIKRIMDENEDPDATWPYILENVFIPLGLVLTVAGVNVLCIAVEFYTGMAITVLGAGTFFSYSLSLALTSMFGRQNSKKVENGI